VATRRPLGALAALRPLPAAPRLLRSRRARSARMTLGTIRPPLSLAPLGAVGTATRLRVGPGRSLSRARHRRCLAVGAHCRRSDGSSRNELRPRLTLGATLARPTVIARLTLVLRAADLLPPRDD